MAEKEKKQNWIPIIDAGHGGIDEKGIYQTEGKRYKFTGKDQENFEIFEGDINRKIAQILISILKERDIEFFDLNSQDTNNRSQEERVNIANTIYKENKSHFFLSIHCNSNSTNLEGSGSNKSGFEILYYKGNEKAKHFAKIAEKQYSRHFAGIPVIGIKESNFYAFRYTKYPAIQLENLFIDNYEEALFLNSTEGQSQIAECLADIISSIAELDNDSIGQAEERNQKPTQKTSTTSPETEDETKSETYKQGNNWLSIKADQNSDKTISIENDQLGYSIYSKAISTTIKKNIKGKPFNIGIIAPWGHGKTTLMEFIREDLEPNSTKKDAKIKDQFLTSIKDLKAWIFDNKNEQFKFRAFKEFHPTVWFNAWKYQSSDQIWAGIGHAIINQLVEKLSPQEQEKFWFKLKNKTINKQTLRKKLFKYIYQNLPITLVAGLLALLIIWGLHLLIKSNFKELSGYLSSTIGIGGIVWSYSNIKKIFKKLKSPVEGFLSEPITPPDYSTGLGMYHQLSEDIQHVFDLLIDSQKPAVVFIDDLDRCSPDVVADVIEAINLIMTNPGIGDNCFFIFGMDAQVVSATLDEKYKNLEGKLPGQEHTHGSVGWYFLDKFIQLPFIIPVANQEDKKNFLSEFFKPDEKEDDTNLNEIIDRLKKAMDDGNDKKVSEIMDESKVSSVKQKLQETFVTEKINNTEEDSPEIMQQVEYMTKYLSSSPREIKRYINLLRLHNVLQGLRKADQLEIPAFQEIAKWLLISLKWPQVVRWIQWENEQDLVFNNTPKDKAEKIDDIISSFFEEHDIPVNKDNTPNLSNQKTLDNWRSHIKTKKVEKLEWLEDKQLFFILAETRGKRGKLSEAINCKVW